MLGSSRYLANPMPSDAIGSFLRSCGDWSILQASISAQFSGPVQDALADVLLEKAGFLGVRAGRIGRQAFMNKLAKIWAGLPTCNGKIHYHGYAGNRATKTWACLARKC